MNFGFIVNCIFVMLVFISCSQAIEAKEQPQTYSACGSLHLSSFVMEYVMLVTVFFYIVFIRT